MDMPRKTSPIASTASQRRYAAPLRGALAVLIALACGAAVGAPVTVPNGDFSDAGNQGSIGGGVVGSSGSGPIGSGPWQGAYAGVVAFLAPPTLTISSGAGTISGLGVFALGVNNHASFNQTLAASYVPVKHYVLAADIDAGVSTLGLNVLTSGNAGLALTSGANTIGSTQTAASVALSLASHTKYHLVLGYDSTVADSGNIGVALFSNPTGVLAANLLSHIAFDNVGLTQAPIPPLPPAGINPVSGTPQAAAVNTAFSSPLVVSVVDAEGDPLEGITVTFTAPASGAGVNLSSTSVMTDVGGRVSVNGTANGTEGQYVVTAAIDGFPPAEFVLKNTAAGQAAIIAFANGGEQLATVGQPFACLIAVKVISGDTPADGATVLFEAPLVGASAVLDDGVGSGPVLVETADANGVAAVSATANATPGSYNITATATALTSGTLLPVVLLASYPMTNLAANDRIFATGFEIEPGLCGSF